MSEQWREIPDFTAYEASDLGRIRSWKTRGRYCKTRAKKPRILIPSLSQNGYLRLSLRSDDGTRVYTTIHRLVAYAFVPGREPGLIVCHNDSNRLNNMPSNLRWDTVSSNAIDASKLGDIPRQVLDIEQVREIRDLYKTGNFTHRSLAAKFGVTHQAIRDVLIRKNYRWVA